MTTHNKAQNILLAAGGAGAVLLLASGCSSKQPPPESTPPQAATPAPASEPEPASPEEVPAEENNLTGDSTGSGVSDSDVEAFARAYVAVANIERKYTEKLQAVGSPQEAQQVQEAARSEMENAIRESGMTIQEFESLGQRAGNDEVLQVRIQEKILELEPPKGVAR